ncbi:hypothetical protein K503DRAFT_864666 [Rhizopogon vinicolor AM-OR11-026]|uniref:Uncharacterized protein n=1 Tax=Rhizopogon vinicolor AM-OR11-026 TaxID=1314800 RepID=A0A1B7N6D6_9AGAM|nr:hypothetical protein K503DRAFT_864666 [Rhizopogon vinicolor AM-OR11-026]
MTSLVSTDSFAILSSMPHDMIQVLTGVRHIMETSLAQDSKLLDIISILATQAEQIKERDHSIMIMQSKIDSQQAIIEEIRSEQRLLTAAVASFSQSHAQDARDASATLSPPDIRETPEPVSHAATPEKSQSTPKLVTNAPSDTTTDGVVHVKTTTATDDTWRIPECYAKTQRGGELRRQGAFYDTPDWHAMTVAAGDEPDSGVLPLSPPENSITHEEIIHTLESARADVNRKLEARQKKDTAAIPSMAAASDDGDRASDTSPRSSAKRCREPDEQEVKRSPNPMDISSIIHDAPDGGSPPFLPDSSSSSGHCHVQDDGSKRRRLSTDIVESTVIPEKKRPTRKSPRREPN